MKNPDTPKKPNHTGWLWWLALVISAVGGWIAYQLKHSPVNPDASQQYMLAVMITVIGAGICMIAATSRWWMHH